MQFDPALLKGLRGARHVAILTGAGISADSGIPTFRDKLTGLWEQYDPSELATPAAFKHDGALVWGWYEWRRMMVLRAQPNAAHRAIATLSELVPQLALVTQNVDDLHERAGSPGVLHLHGELARPYCEACRNVYRLPEGIPDLPVGGKRIPPPQCVSCGGRVRPGVVWFGEGLPELTWHAAVTVSSVCDVFIIVGTSALVQPAASLVHKAAAAGALTIQVNPNTTGLEDAVSVSLRGPAGQILPALVQQAWCSPAR
ncbi:MAG: NAD-dependent deacylase [Pseudomonadota bacterium]|jgi:NAD-dependent deacetylase|nr:NAD-dependent deacylase [Pseudomonadota bacterium]